MLVLTGAGVAGASFLGARWFNIFARNGEVGLTPVQAHQSALSGDILLVDIRRPDEWAHTGVGVGAIAIDMRRDDFEDALRAAAGRDTDQPIALICARGVRSHRLAARLEDAGFTRVMDVPEGMLGSGAGPGWVRRGLPVVLYR